MEPMLLIALLFISMLVLLFLTGSPIVFLLGGVTAAFMLFLWGTEHWITLLYQVWSLVTGYLFVGCALFIFMASIIQYSGIADTMYDAMHKWAGGLRGGLAIGTIVFAAIFAAMVGETFAGTACMGLIALPSMLKRGYDKQMVLGAILAGGALGVLIPPSVDFMIMAFFTRISVGKMFLGGVFPGLLLVCLFITYIAIRCRLNPKMGPPLPPEERVNWGEKLRSLKGVLLPIMIIIMVLGSIYGGIASPTEAAGVGCLGAIIAAAVNRRLNFQVLKEASLSTLNVIVMIMWIAFAAMAFATVLSASGASKALMGTLMELPLERYAIIGIMQGVIFALGAFLDGIGIIVMTTPIFLPVIKVLGFVDVWYGVLFILNMQMAYLTPPYGLNLFVLKSVTPPEISMGDLYRAVWPFVILQAIGLAIVMFVPQIALWLPNLVTGR